MAQLATLLHCLVNLAKLDDRQGTDHSLLGRLIATKTDVVARHLVPLRLSNDPHVHILSTVALLFLRDTVGRLALWCQMRPLAVLVSTKCPRAVPA